MRKSPIFESTKLSTLAIPYRYTGFTDSADDFIQVEDAFTIGSPDSFDEVDLVAYPVLEPKREDDWSHLLSRSAKLPESGDWLDEYLSSQSGRTAIAAKSNAGYVIGHPRDSLGNQILYGDDASESVVSTEAVVLEGKVTFSQLPGYLELHFQSAPISMPGFSGAPVFAPVATPQGRQFVLIGMCVCGSSRALNFLPVGRLLEAAIGNAPEKYVKHKR